jgi:hypothetical protein
MEGQNTSPFRWLLVLPGGVIGFSIGQFLFAAWKDAAAVVPPLAILNGAAWVIGACISAGLFILLGTKAAPTHKLPTAIVLGLLTATWSGALLTVKREGLITAFLPLESAHSQYLMPYAAVLTVLLAAFLCIDLARRERRFNMSGLSEYYFEREDEHPDNHPRFRTHVYSGHEEDDRRDRHHDDEDDDAPLSVPDVFTPSSSMKEQMFMASDLVLLERELLKIEPSVDAYVSALRLGIAIEKDEGYQNLDGECFSFSQLMRDLAMRLSVPDSSDERWLQIAGLFRQYEKAAESERKQMLAQVSSMLEVKEQTQESAEGETAEAKNSEQRVSAN